MGRTKIPNVAARSFVIILVLANLQCSVNVAGQNNSAENNVQDSDCRYSAKPLRSVPAGDLYRLGRDLMADSGRTDPQLPCWFDPNLARVGQRFARTNFAQLVIAHFLSLFLLIANPDIRRILYFTMRSADPDTAYQRYIATALQAKLWYDVEILHANVSTEVREVRNIHRATAHRIEDENLDFTWPLVESTRTRVGSSQERSPHVGSGLGGCGGIRTSIIFCARIKTCWNVTATKSYWRKSIFYRFCTKLTTKRRSCWNHCYG